MKTLAALILLTAGLSLGTGCSTPAYSGHERARMIGRNIAFEGSQIQDDIDHALLLRPVGHLTVWHVR